VKKLIILFIILPNFLYAFDSFNVSRGHSGYFFDNYDIRWSVGDIGYDYSFQNNGDNTEIFYDYLNVGIKHRNTGLGLEFSPFRIWDWKYNSNVSLNKTSYSFLNFGVYWNIFEIIFVNDSLKLFFGPFSRINYMHYHNRNSIIWSNYVFTSGFRLGLVAGQHDIYANNIFNSISMNVVNGEVGYRIVNGESYFYVGVKTDIIMFFLLLFGSAINTD